MTQPLPLQRANFVVRADGSLQFSVGENAYDMLTTPAECVELARALLATVGKCLPSLDMEVEEAIRRVAMTGNVPDLVRAHAAIGMAFTATGHALDAMSRLPINLPAGAAPAPGSMELN